MIDLREICKERRWRYEDKEILCEYGVIYKIPTIGICACVNRGNKRIIYRLFKLGFEPRGFGHFHSTEDKLFEAAEIMNPLKCLKKEYHGGTLELVSAKQPEKLRSRSFKTHFVNGMVDEIHLLPIVDLAQPEDEKPSVPEKPEYKPLVSKRPADIFKEG